MKHTPAFKQFKKILKSRYGLDPEDVDVYNENDYLSAAGGDKPAAVVGWFGQKYGLETLAEMSQVGTT